MVRAPYPQSITLTIAEDKLEMGTFTFSNSEVDCYTIGAGMHHTNYKPCNSQAKLC